MVKANPSFRRAAAPLAVALVLAAGRVAGQTPEPPDLARPLPLDPSLTVGTLPNGLRYYVRSNPKPEKRAEFRLAVNAGSVLEDEDQRGLAHFVEHMAFNGTTHFKKQELVDFIEGIGMRLGPDLNAYTSFDETVYLLQVPTDSSQIVARALQILSDWAQGLTLDPEEVRKERGVVVEEWRLGRGAGARMRDKQFPTLFKDSRYAQRLPIGEKSIIETADVATIKRFYADWYRPDLMAVIAVGDFRVEEIEKLIQANFAAIPPARNPKPRPLFPVPDHDTTLVSIATDREATNTGVSVYYKQPLREQRTVGDYRQGIVENLYNQMFNSRLYELTQKPDPPYIGAGSGQGRLVRSKETYILNAAVKDGGAERGLEALLTEAERVDRYGFTQPELDRAGKALLRGLEQAYAEREKTLSNRYASEYVRCFLEAEPTPGIAYEYEVTRALVPGISLAEVNRLAQAWITDQSRVILVDAPDKPGVPVPPEKDLFAVFDRVKKTAIVAYADTVSDAPLVSTNPALTAIVSERVDTSLGTRGWTLANGVRVILKPTDFKADEVLFTAYSPGGASLAPDGSYLNAMFASRVANLGGLSRFSAIELQKKLAGKAVRVSPFIGSEQEGLGGSASPKDLETMFQLIYLTFTAPRRDTTAFQAFTTNTKAALANRGANPLAAFQDTLGVTLAQHHPRALPVTSERIDEIHLDEAMVFYRSRFADASDFTFVFVGNFAPDSLRTLVRTYLGGLPSLHRKEMWKDTGIRPPKGVIERTLKRGIEPKSQTAIVFTGPLKYTPENRLVMGSMAQVLDIRLREQLREEMGGTYGVGVNASSSRIPRQEYTVRIGFGAAPARVDSLAREVFVQIDSLKRLGPSEKDLGKVKEIQVRTYETNLKQNGYWLSQLASHDQNGEDSHNILTYRRRVEGLTKEAIRDAARRYLNEKNYVRVTLYPEDKPNKP